MKLLLNKITIPAIICDKKGYFVRGNRTPETLPCLGRSLSAASLLSEELYDAYRSLSEQDDMQQRPELPYLICKGAFCTLCIIFNGSSVFSDVASDETLWLFLNQNIPPKVLSEFFLKLVRLCGGKGRITARELAANAVDLSQKLMLTTEEKRLNDDLPFSFEVEEAISTLKKCAEVFTRERGAYSRCSVQSQAAADTSSIISRIPDFHRGGPLFMSLLSAFCDITESGIVNIGFLIADDALKIQMTTECKVLSSKTEYAPARLVEKALSDVESTAKDLFSDICRMGWTVQRQRRVQRERLCADAELIFSLVGCAETGIRNRSEMEAALCDLELAKILVGIYKAASGRSTGRSGDSCLGCRGINTKFTLLSHSNHN